jgi:dTDP-4-amino-4,6-dideoxygalactose transaminase
MKVPYNYLPMQFSDTEEVFSQWKELISSAEFTLGPYVEKFEREFGEFIGAKHVISTNNGTDALILSLKACGIGNGDEVISVPTTFYASIGAIVAVGAKPVFVDIDDRYQMEVNQVERAITSKTKALLPVHWAGASPKMPEIMKVARMHGLKVIEDACMAPGGQVEGRHAGTHGDVGAWSMHPLKPLNVMGDGGMVSTDNDELAGWMRMYRNHGMRNRDLIDIWGVNMRLQPLQAIVASNVLKSVHTSIASRSKVATAYDLGLQRMSDFISTPSRIEGYKETVSLYMIKCESRDDLLQYLIANGVEAKIHYPIPLHLQKAAESLGYKMGDFPVSEDYAQKILTLPAHQYLSSDQVEYVIEAIGNFYGN